jgi:hypothetical protein
MPYNHQSIPYFSVLFVVIVNPPNPLFQRGKASCEMRIKNNSLSLELYVDRVK